MIHSILPVQITCLAIFLHNIFPCPLWSTSWSGALHLIFHTFLHPISAFFSQHMRCYGHVTCPYHRNLFCCSKGAKRIQSSSQISHKPCDNRFWATVCKTVHPMLSDRCLSCLSVTLVYCGQTVGWIKTKLGKVVGLGHIVLDGDPAPPPKGAQSPFSAHVRCGQTAARIKMPLGTEVGLGPGHCVRWGPSPTPERGTIRPFRPRSIVAKRSPMSANADHLLKIGASTSSILKFSMTVQI